MPDAPVIAAATAPSKPDSVHAVAAVAFAPIPQTHRSNKYPVRRHKAMLRDAVTGTKRREGSGAGRRQYVKVAAVRAGRDVAASNQRFEGTAREPTRVIAVLPKFHERCFGDYAICHAPMIARPGMKTVGIGSECADTSSAGNLSAAAICSATGECQ